MTFPRLQQFVWFLEWCYCKWAYHRALNMIYRMVRISLLSMNVQVTSKNICLFRLSRFIAILLQIYKREMAIGFTSPVSLNHGYEYTVDVSSRIPSYIPN